MDQVRRTAYRVPSFRPKRREGVVIFLLAIVVLVAVSTATLSELGIFSGAPQGVGRVETPIVGPGPSPFASFTLVRGGTDWNLSPGQHEDVGPVNLTSRCCWYVNGTFDAWPGVTAWAMNSSEYVAWAGAGIPKVYQWTSGPNFTLGDNNLSQAFLMADLYFFVWEGSNPALPSRIVFTSSVNAVYYP
ncbi:MAG: hypothetical protein ACHQ2Y_07275 [Candidatus Lutacidiplasmatales archaeon]